MTQIFDSHVHTSNSFDCNSDPTALCGFAIAKNIKGISITDHWEVGLNRKNQFNLEIMSSIQTAIRLSEKYKNQLIVLTGIEIGQPHHCALETASAMDLHDYDFVLASCHCLRGYKDFCDFKPDQQNIDYILLKYFDEILEMINTQDFDTLAHLTYPLRYIQGIHKINVNIEKYAEIIDIILKALIQSNKSLEINTYGKRQCINDYSPCIDIVSHYKQLGGQLITIGSDAHRPEDVGSNIIDVIEHLRILGFTSYNYYIKRIPQSVSIN